MAWSRFVILTDTNEHVDPPCFVDYDAPAGLDDSVMAAVKAKAGYADRVDVAAYYWGGCLPDETQFDDWVACIERDGRRYVVSGHIVLRDRAEVEACIADLRRAADSLWPEV